MATIRLIITTAAATMTSVDNEDIDDNDHHNGATTVTMVERSDNDHDDGGVDQENKCFLWDVEDCGQLIMATMTTNMSTDSFDGTIMTTMTLILATTKKRMTTTISLKERQSKGSN